jgi:hypothetical protein
LYGLRHINSMQEAIYACVGVGIVRTATYIHGTKLRFDVMITQLYLWAYNALTETETLILAAQLPRMKSFSSLVCREIRNGGQLQKKRKSSNCSVFDLDISHAHRCNWYAWQETAELQRKNLDLLRLYFKPKYVWVHKRTQQISNCLIWEPV